MLLCCRLGRTLMRIHVSNDMGTGGFGFLCVGLMLSIIFENEPCVSCYQASAASFSLAGWQCPGVLFSSWSAPELEAKHCIGFLVSALLS